MKAMISLIILIGLPYSAAQAESFIEVTKSVNNPVPAANEPVEFTVQVTNTGDQSAAEVYILDKLPAEMEIPDGTAAFPSVGEYDPIRGEWLIGDMDAGAGATLVMPAVVIDPDPPACIINTASIGPGVSSNGTNSEGSAVIYQSAGQRCVDLSASPDVYTQAELFATCDSEEPYLGTIDVQNAGPDVARNVVVSFTQAPVVGASIRFDDDRCEHSGSDICTIGEIGPGEMMRLSITSDVFQNYTGVDFDMSVEISTSDIDYFPQDNLLTLESRAGGFSSCEEVDFPGPGTFEVGPGCFIATAAYGSALDPHLDSLRAFRDDYLLTNLMGRSLVYFYYEHSPPLADFIADRDGLRAIVRAVLTPIVFAVEYPGATLMLTIAMLFVCVRWRRHRRLARIANNAAACSAQL